jgi:hypothetical protein
MTYSDGVPRLDYHADLADVDRGTVDRVLLGLLAHPENPQQACFASGEESWTTYTQGLDLLVLCGLAEEVSFGVYAVTAAGRAHGMQLITDEQYAVAAGRLSRRQASRCHADLAYQHVVSLGSPVARKLEAVMHGQPAEPLTDAEAELVAAHIEMQTGPAEQDLIDALRAGTLR